MGRMVHSGSHLGFLWISLDFFGVDPSLSSPGLQVHTPYLVRIKHSVVPLPDAHSAIAGGEGEYIRLAGVPYGGVDAVCLFLEGSNRGR
ncbi:hypothetical protein ACFX15_013825 [Malus domestica]